MLDQRFYIKQATLTIAEIVGAHADWVIDGPTNITLEEIAAFDLAQPGDMTFYSGNTASALNECRATACFVKAGINAERPEHLTTIGCADPRGSFASAAAHMAQLKLLDPASDAIHSDASIPNTTVLEPGAVVGQGVELGEMTRIGAGAVIGPGVQIGRSCNIGANATIYCSLIGDNVTILPGAVIGQNGFGLRADGQSLLPHFGRVIIQDGATIGANSCVDRGMLGDTIIGERSHIDNLCHIGHNVTIGRGSVMAAFAGVSGSSIVGDQVMFGGRVGLSDHVTVGTGAKIAAGAAVLQDVPPGETWAGYPAKPIKGWMRELAWLRRAAQKKSRAND